MKKTHVTKELLKRPIAYHAIVAKAFKSVKLALLWSQLYYWSDKTKDEEEWVYKTQDEMYEETGLSRKEQETARALGKKLEVIEDKVAGTPPKLHYRINLDKTIEVLEKYVSTLKPKQKAETSDLPDWLDKEVWAEWEQYRKESRKKLTPTTIKRQLALLEKHKEDHVAIIEKSIQNGWTGLFPEKEKKGSKLESKAGKYANVGEKV